MEYGNLKKKKKNPTRTNNKAKEATLPWDFLI